MFSQLPLVERLVMKRPNNSENINSYFLYFPKLHLVLQCKNYQVLLSSNNYRFLMALCWQKSSEEWIVFMAHTGNFVVRLPCVCFEEDVPIPPPPRVTDRVGTSSGFNGQLD